jgi:hypothetical protein
MSRDAGDQYNNAHHQWVWQSASLDLPGRKTNDYSIRSLPTSLTHLVLENVRIKEGCHIFKFENVTSLSLTNVAFIDSNYSNVTDAPKRELDPWLSSLLRTVKHVLIEFKYIVVHELSQTCCVSLARALPKSLETLAITHCMFASMKDEYWPSTLTSLTIYGPTTPTDWLHQRLRQSVTFDVHIPATVTSLSIDSNKSYLGDGWLNDLVANDFYLTRPTAIQRLSIKCYTYPADLMCVVSKLTSLKSVALHWLYCRFRYPNFVSMPKSVEFFDIPGVEILRNKHWHLYSPATRFAVNEETLVMPVMVYAMHDEAFLPSLPRAINAIQVANGPLPVALPALEHVYFSCVPTNSLPRHLSDVYLTNLPRLLRSINVNTRKADDMFWLHNEGDDSSLFKSRFPNLTTFRLFAYETSVTPSIVQSWFRHLPQTLYHLRLEIDKYDENDSLLDLTNILLPPMLISLSLTCKAWIVTLPNVLPSSLDPMCIHIHSHHVDLVE